MRRRDWLGGKQVESVTEGEIKELTNQFYVTLRAYFARIQAPDGKLAPDALQRLKELWNPTQPRSWSEAYEIEQMLVHLFDAETLKTELGVRSLERLFEKSSMGGISSVHFGDERQSIPHRPH